MQTQTHPLSDASRCTQTCDQRDKLGIAASENEKLVQELEARFGSVLRATPPTEAACPPNTPQEHLVPLADSLRDITNIVKRANSAIRSILDRAEL